MKRSKDRHQMLAHSSSFRYRRSTSPYLIDERSNPEFGSQLMPFVCPIEIDTSSSSTPSPGFPRFNGRDRSNSSCSLNYRGSPYDLSGLSSSNDIMHPLRRNSDPSSPAAVISPPIPMDSEGEYDQPLDMSKKSRKSPDSESHSNNNHYQHLQQQHSRSNNCSPEAGKFGIRHQQQQQITANHYHHNPQPHMQPRPSVITCASNLFGPRSGSSNACHKSTLNKNDTPKINISSPSNSKIPLTSSKSSPSPKTLLHRDMANDLSKQQQNHNNQQHHQYQIKFGQRGETPNKMLILREDSDSGIDEHFRRSLGEHYSGYTNVSMSVDDHFAKALGETWLKLKEEAQNGTKGSSYNKNVPSIPS